MATINMILSWLAAIVITICIWSWLFKDNIGFRVAQRTFVAFGAAHYFNMALVSLRNTAWNPIVINGDLVRVIPVILGLLTWFIMTERYYWVSRYGVLVLVAVTTNLSLTGMMPSMVTGQMRSLVDQLWKSTGAWDVAWAYIGIGIAFLIMTYFLFIWLQAPAARLGAAGRFVMYASFGVLFGAALLGNMIQIAHMLIEIFVMKWPF
jgi:hypothetical protein